MINLYGTKKLQKFLDERSTLLTKQLNETLKAWKEGRTPPLKKNRQFRLGDGLEFQRLEFKSTFWADANTGENNSLRDACVKVVASLPIPVEDFY